MPDTYPIRLDISRPGEVKEVPAVPAGYRAGQRIGEAATTAFRMANPLAALAEAAYRGAPAVASSVAPVVEGALGFKPGVLTAPDRPTMKAAAKAPAKAAAKAAPVGADNGPRAFYDPKQPSEGLPLNVLERIVAMAPAPKPMPARDQAIGQASALSQGIFQNAINSIEEQYKAGNISQEQREKETGSAIQAMYERQARLVGYQQLPQFQLPPPEE